MDIKELLEGTSTKARCFDIFIQCLIMISLITFSIDTLPHLEPETKKWLFYVEVITVAIFSVEYIARVWVATQKSKFIFSFFGIIDILSILPFYLALGMDLRSMRILRMLRLFRIFKLARYNRALAHFFQAFVRIREELVLFFICTLMLVYLSAAGIYFFEYEAQPETFSSIFHSLWWAVATLTTVGYGDIYPITVGGRTFTFIILLIGLGIVSVPSGLLASSLATTDNIKTDDEENTPETKTKPKES